MSRPNIWVIMMDQLRWDAMGCYGNDIVETSYLDDFAAQGTVFENCYSPAPVCVPARASMLTGKNPWNVGVMYRDPAKKGDVDLGTTYPKVLSDNGYHNLCVGWLGGGMVTNALRGFHEVHSYVRDYARWFEDNKPGDCYEFGHGLGMNSWISRPWHLPEYLHPTAWTALESVRLLERRDPHKPFFLKTSFSRPHAPYDPPQFYFDLYNNMDLPEPVTGNDWDEMHNFPTTDPDAWHGRLGKRQAQRAKAGYYGSIHFVDHQIGIVRQYLQRERILDDTIIIFTADHGDMMGDHHLWRKSYPYEGSAHIPLIVRLPPSMRENIAPRCAAPVSLLDIMPTILDACDIEAPEGLDGASLVPALRGENMSQRDYIHGEHRRVYAVENEHHFIVDGQWKYIWFTQTGQEQLFNLQNDPYEKDDLASSAEYAEELRKWRARMITDLEKREAGLVQDGKLVVGEPVPISPHFKTVK